MRVLLPVFEIDASMTVLDLRKECAARQQTSPDQIILMSQVRRMRNYQKIAEYLSEGENDLTCFFGIKIRPDEATRPILLPLINGSALSGGEA
jgi:hypothetical protein